jgi:putative ABC transport system ATP-binding protein
VKAHAEHFTFTFPQIIALYMLYAVASAGLLALGGWLVIQEQLSIGQLVAAELILSGVFAGMNILYSYLDDWYDVVAAVEELGMLYGIQQEPPPPPGATRPRGGALSLSAVRFPHNGETVLLDFAVPEGARLVCQGVPGMERKVANLLKRIERPQAGLITLGGVDLAVMDPLALRSDIIVLDRASMVESTIADYLRLANPDRNAADHMAALQLVGLEDRLALLPDGIHTLLASTGAPFSVTKVMQLKLAAAVLAEPRILVLSPLCDTIAAPRLQAVFDHFRGKSTTILYFSNRPEAITLDGWLWLGAREQEICMDQARFDALRSAAGRETING